MDVNCLSCSPFILHCIQNPTKQGKGGGLSLLSSGGAASEVLGPVLSSTVQERPRPNRVRQQRATKMIKWLVQISLWGKAKKHGMFSLQNTQGHLISDCKFLKRRSREDGAGLLLEVLSSKTAGWHWGLRITAINLINFKGELDSLTVIAGILCCWPHQTRLCTAFQHYRHENSL